MWLDLGTYSDNLAAAVNAWLCSSFPFFLISTFSFMFSLSPLCGIPRIGEMSTKDRMIVEFINEVCEDDGTLKPLDTETVLEMLAAPTTKGIEEILIAAKFVR